ncbi:MAG: VanZ family protein, partial [Bacteroidota bacterium]
MASTLLNKINRQWSAVVCWALTLFVLSVIPSRNLPRINIWDDLISTDKLAHAFVYGVFAVLLYQALKSQSRYAALLATSLAIFFGATMELL